MYFCRDGSGYFTGAPEISVSLQLDSEIKRIRKKFPDSGIIAYFQANTNTYANIEKLKHIYLPICQNTEITGISIGTRADCLSDEVMELLSYIDRHTSLTVELGMQTVHNKTLKLINTNYSHEEFIDGYKKLKKQGIRTCLHIINGLPGESENMMLKTAEELAVLNPDAVKIQLLHILKDTPLEKMYLNGDIKVMSKSEYISTVISQLELLPAETVVEGITGDGDKKYLIAPLWSRDKISVIGGIDKEMVRRNTFQGKKYNINP